MLSILNIAVVLLLSSCSTLKEIPLEGVKEERAFFQPIWIKNLDVGHDTGNLPVGLQGPAVADGILYIGNNNGPIEAYDFTNGRKIWSGTDNSTSFHSAPLVFGQLVVYGNIDGRLSARDRLSGELAYNVDLGGAIEEKPTYFNGRLFVHTRNHKVVCLDALTGKILWAYKRAVPFLTTLQRVSRPYVYGNRVYVGFADGAVGAFGIDEGALLWESKVVDGPKFIDVDASPLVYKNKLIVGSIAGELSVLSLNNGVILRRIPHHISRAPLVVEDGLVLANSEGEVVFLNENLDEKRKIKVSDSALTSIAKWKEHYVVGSTDGELIAVKKNLIRGEGEKLSSFDFGHVNSSLFADLVVQDGLLAAYSSRNRLYIFK